MSKLYVITFKESKEMITPDSIKKFWKNYGSARSSGLYGWKPPKKVYFTLGQARRGFAFIPDELKPQCEISIFAFSESVQDGEDLQATQAAAKAKREKEQEIKSLEWQIDMFLRRIDNTKQDKTKVEQLMAELEKLRKE